jgi:PAS domain S-box-containing protein
MNLLEYARRSIRFRLWILLVAMSMVILAIGTIIFGLYGWNTQRRQFEANLVSIAELIGLNSKAALSFDDEEIARQDMELIRSHKDIVYAGLLDADGRVFAENGLLSEESHACNDQGLVKPGICYPNRARICVTTPIEHHGRVIGYVRLEKELAEMNHRVVTLMASAFGGFLFTLLVAMVLSHRIGRTITGPITHLASMIRQVSDTRRIGSPAFVTSRDEVGDLARGINVMLDNLETSRQALEQSLSLQQTLFDTIPMPVYGKNIERRFTAMNHQFATDVIGQPANKVIGRLQEEYPENFDAESLDLLRRKETTLLLTGQEQPFEVIGRDATGRHIIFRIQLGLYHDADGKTAGLMGVMQDITEIRRIGRELIDVSMREQQRLARDLHDNLGQLLTATACKIKTLDYAIEENQTALKSSLAEVIALVNRAAREARAMSHGLNPVDVERGGLVRALQELADSTTVYARLTCRFSVADNLPELEKEISNQLYRIAQEAVSNAVRHAGATTIDIHLAPIAGDVVLTITDDGAGLPDGQEDATTGMGLRIMNQRALMIHGELKYHNRSSGGTTVSCRGPITPGAS